MVCQVIHWVEFWNCRTVTRIRKHHQNPTTTVWWVVKEAAVAVGLYKILQTLARHHRNSVGCQLILLLAPDTFADQVNPPHGTGTQIAPCWLLKEKLRDQPEKQKPLHAHLEKIQIWWSFVGSCQKKLVRGVPLPWVHFLIMLSQKVLGKKRESWYWTHGLFRMYFKVAVRQLEALFANTSASSEVAQGSKYLTSPADWWYFVRLVSLRCLF